MIEKMRSGYSRGTRTIYWVTAVSMLGLSSVPIFFKALFRGGSAIARVNGISIDNSLYRYTVLQEQRIRDMYREQFGSHYSRVLALFGKTEDPQESALEQLVTEHLLLSIAHKIPLALSSAYIARKLRDAQTVNIILGGTLSQAMLDERGMLRHDVLRLFLQRHGLTLADFEHMAESRLAETMVARIAQGAGIVSLAMREEQVITQGSGRTFRLLLLPLKGFIADALSFIPTADEIKEFYTQENRNRATYRSEEQRSGTVWSFDIDPAKGDMHKEEVYAVLASGREDIFQEFIQAKAAKQSALVLVPRALSTKEASVEALFTLSAPGDRTVQLSAAGTKLYIVELISIAPRVDIPLAEIQDRVITDMRHLRAISVAEKVLSAGDDRRIVQSSVAVKPREQINDTAEGKKYTLPAAATYGMVARGQTRKGSTAEYVWKLTLTQIDDTAGKSGDDATVTQQLTQSSQELVMNKFVASLRSHAIIVLEKHADRV